MEFFTLQQSRCEMKKIIILSLIFLSTVVNAQIFYTQKNNNFLREGPAAYYPLISVLPKGERVKVLKDKSNWVEVKTNNGKTGWMSKKSLSQNKQKHKLSELAKKWSSAEVSAITLAGAVKGLRGKAQGGEVEDLDRLLLYTHYSVTPTQIDNFIREMSLYESSNRGEVDWDDAGLNIKEPELDLPQLAVGFSVAARIASQPLIINDDIRNYIYLIMNALTANSDFYDTEFSILILNQNQADGFSCPGGVIFITKGVFLIAKDESELAAAIAHELGHQLLHHNEIELSKRSTNISAEEMFAELDAEIQTEENEEDLNKLINASYEKVVHERTLDYEFQADKFAAILLANAGYDPFAIVRLTSRLAKTFKAERDIFSDDYLSPNDMQTRADKIKDFVNENFNKENPGERFPKRFNAYFSFLYKE